MKKTMMRYLILLFTFLSVHHTSFAQQNIIDDIESLIKAGKIAEADNLTNRYLVDDPVNTDLLMMKGNVLLNQHIIEQQAQLSIRPNYNESIYDMNVLENGPHPISLDKKTAGRIAKLWWAAATLDPAREDMDLGLCQVYAISDMADALVAYLPTLKEKVVNVEDLHYQMATYARNLKERGDFEGSVAVYKEIARLYPEKKGLLSDIAGEYFFADQADSARHYIQLSLANAGTDETILGNAFFISSLLGDYDTALEAIRRLPGNGNLLYEGVLKFYRGEKKWQKPLEKFLQGNPDSTDAIAAKVLIDKDLKLNLDTYLRLTELDLGDATKILIHQKFWEAGGFLPIFNTAETYSFNHQFRKAVSVFANIGEKELNMDAEDRETYLFYYAWALRQNGQLDAAKEQWAKLLGSSDFYKKSAAHWFVGKYFFDKGEKEKGREYFAKMATDPSASKYATMCWNYMGE